VRRRGFEQQQRCEIIRLVAESVRRGRWADGQSDGDGDV
jgi:hypothetical protein